MIIKIIIKTHYNFSWLSIVRQHARDNENNSRSAMV